MTAVKKIAVTISEAADMVSATAQGHDAMTLFGGVTENPGPKGGRPREDFHLARFTCHLKEAHL